MKKISIFVNPNVKPILKGSSRAFAMALDEAPSGDVTVSFSSANSFVTFGSSLTFTTGNYNIPQTVTITAIDNATPEGYKEETIICTPSGGGYSKELKFKINICDAYIDYELLRRKQWYGTHIRQLSDIDTLRSSMIDYLFNGNGMPTNAVPDSLVSGYTGVCGQFNTSALTGVTRVDSLTFNFTDWRAGVWASKVYHIITSSTPKNILVMVMGGHGSELYHLNCVQDLLNNGFDVAYCFLPVTFQNTTTSPSIRTGVNGHNDIEEQGLETPSFSGMELFLYDKIMTLNYMDANYSYISYYGTGCSGGGNMMKTVQAIDTRIIRAVSVRGYQAYSGVAWEAGQDFASDYEQGGSIDTQQSIIDSNYYDHIYLGTSGGRRHYATHNVFDTVTGTFSFNLYKDFLPPKVHAMTGGTFGLFLDSNIAGEIHGWNTLDRQKMIEQFLLL